MIAQTGQATVEQLQALIALPENAERRFELIGGEIYEVVSNNYASMIAMLIGGLMVVFVQRHKLGHVTGADGGYIVGEERYIPDVAFISLARQPQPSREAYNPNAPDLAVEVVSPSDDPRRLTVKISNYLAAGVIVWVVYPEDKHIDIHTPAKPVQTLRIDNMLDGGALLPGFSLSLKDIFAE